MIKRSRAMSLVELLVGITVGALVILTVFSSISLYQGVRRTSVSGNNAMANAMTGIHFMTSDIQLAGLGFVDNGAFLCNNVNLYYDGSIILNNARMEPIRLVDGASDSITLIHANSSLSGAQAQLLSAMEDLNGQINVNKAAGAQLGNIIMLADSSASSPCSVLEVTGVDSSGTTATVEHNSAGAKYNPSSPSVFSSSTAYSTDAVVVNAGSISYNTWRVNNNILEVVNNITGNVEQIADNIVQLQAEYGVSNPGSEQISAWVPATGSWANPSNADLRRIRAVRIAVIARSAYRERAINNACVTTTQVPATWPGSAAVDLSAIANWQCYRYRVIKTVVPIKNIIWGNVT